MTEQSAIDGRAEVGPVAAPATSWPEPCQSMTDMAGWDEVTCQDREQFFDRYGEHLKPYSSLTDPDGQYGKPTIYTEWGSKTRDTPWLRDYRYPERKSCAHFMPNASGALRWRCPKCQTLMWAWRRYCHGCDRRRP